MIKQMEKGFLILITSLVLADMSVFAAMSSQILEVCQDDSYVSAYVSGMGEVSEATVFLGKKECDDISYESVSESGKALKTLILIDNSISIPEEKRTETRQLLADLIAARSENEYFAIGTISESVEVQADFTNDYSALKEILDSMVYNDQETYLTDALYDYLAENPFPTDMNSFIRILILSDGVDNKSLGYTKDELLELLKKNPIPIYTVGIYNRRKSNQSELEQMFSIARSSGAESLLLDDMEGKDGLQTMLAQDRDNLIVTVSIPEQAKDGSLQTLTISLISGEKTVTVSADGIRMPLLAEQTEEAEETTEEEKEEPEQRETPAAVTEEETLPVHFLILGIAVIVFLILIVIVTVVIFVRRKQKEQKAIPIKPPVEKTVLVKPQDIEDNGYTMSLWSQGAPEWSIRLTDLNAPTRSYEKVIRKSLVIGRDPTSDVVIGHDKSVSHKQCEIRKEGDQLYLVNHSKANITILNGEEVTDRKIITQGSILRMGRVEMRIDIIK